MVRCTIHPHHTHISLTRHSTLFTPIHNSLSSYLTHTSPLSLLTLISLTNLPGTSITSITLYPRNSQVLPHSHFTKGSTLLHFSWTEDYGLLSGISDHQHRWHQIPLHIFCIFLLFRPLLMIKPSKIKIKEWYQ